MWQFRVYRLGGGHADGIKDEGFLYSLPLQQDGHITEGVNGDNAYNT